MHLLVAGSGCAAVAQAASKIAGVGKVHVADDPAYANALPRMSRRWFAGLMASHDAFLAPATTTGKNIAPRVAALLDVMQISDILSVIGPDTFTRPIYAGNAIATVRSSDKKRVITVRGTAFRQGGRDGRSGHDRAGLRAGRRRTGQLRLGRSRRFRTAGADQRPRSSFPGGRGLGSRPSSSTR